MHTIPKLGFASFMGFISKSNIGFEYNWQDASFFTVKKVVTSNEETPIIHLWKRTPHISKAEQKAIWCPTFNLALRILGGFMLKKHN